MNIKKMLIGFVCSVAMIGCSGGMDDGCCGWSSTDTTATGQIKKVRHHTPLFCPDYYEADVSLGVMKNGVGSMSTQDMHFYVDEKLVPELKEASEKSYIVNITYDQRRIGWCIDEDRITSFKLSDE